MICNIFRSEKKQGAYLYLIQEKNWEDVPEDLQKILGQSTKVMQLDLSKHTKLASEDIKSVKENLVNQGYHLQMPPKITTGVVNYGV